MSALSLTEFSAVTRKEPPLTLMTVLLARAPAAAAWSVPLLILNPAVEGAILNERAYF
jgi:hypothetical protein